MGTDFTYDAKFEEKSVEAPEVSKEIGEADYDRFEGMLKENTALVLHSIDERIKDPKRREQAVKMIFGGKDEDVIVKIFELGDKIKIDQLQQEDPSFNGMSAFIHGVDDTVTFGVGGKIISGSMGSQERRRLLKKAYPGTVFAGELGGFVPLFFVNPFVAGGRGAMKVSAKGLMKAGGAGMFELGMNARPLLQGFAKHLVKKRGKTKLFGELLERAATSKNVMAKAVDLGIGSATFETTKEAVQIADDAANDRPVGDIKERLGKKAGGAFVGGVGMGFGLAVGGKAYNAIKKSWRWTKRRGAMIAGGFDGKYVSENLEVINEVLAKSPESILAMEAKQIEKASNKYLGKLKTREERIKAVMDDETKAFKLKVQKAEEGLRRDLKDTWAKNKKAAEEALEGTGIDFAKDIKSISQAEAKNVAAEAKQLYTKVEEGFRGIGRKYQKEYEKAVQDATARGEAPRVELAPINEHIEKFLTKREAFRPSAGPLDDSLWAKEHPQLYSDLVARWEEFGGRGTLQGASPGTMGLNEFMISKRGVGDNANFGRQATKDEAAWRELFFKMGEASEKSLKELKGINQRYKVNREKFDNFRGDIGDSEVKIARFLENAEKDKGSRLLINESFEAIGEINADLALRVQSSSSLKDRVQLLTDFQKNPRLVVNKIRNAYLKSDTVTIAQLEALADEFPKLRGYLNKAKDQAQMVSQWSDVEALNRAVKDAKFEEKLRAGRPDMAKELDELHQLRIQREHFSETIPNKPKALEKRISAKDFGKTGAEKEQIKTISGESAEAKEAIQRAEVAREVRKQIAGDIERKGVENFNLFGIGDTMFNFRKKLSPHAFKLYVRMQKATPPTRSAVSQAVFDNIQGTKLFDKERLDQLARVMGTEAALVIFGQNGGEDQLTTALEAVAKDFLDAKEAQNE